MGTLHEDQYTISIISRLVLRMKIFQTEVVEKLETHILYSIFFFRKSCLLWDDVGKYSTAGQATEYYMAHAHCMLYT